MNWQESIQQTYQEEISIGMAPKQKIYDLYVRFGGSSTRLRLVRGTHTECLVAAKTFFEYTCDEHKEHNTRRQFSMQLVTPDRMVVTCVNTNLKYSKNSLWATFEIQEVNEVKTND